MRGLLLVPAILAAALVYAAFDEASGIPRWLSQRDGLARAEARITDLEARVASLQTEIRRLKDDPFEIERAIREELKLARAGEAVVRLPPAEASTPRFP